MVPPRGFEPKAAPSDSRGKAAMDGGESCRGRRRSEGMDARARAGQIPPSAPSFAPHREPASGLSELPPPLEIRRARRLARHSWRRMPSAARPRFHFRVGAHEGTSADRCGFERASAVSHTRVPYPRGFIGNRSTASHPPPGPFASCSVPPPAPRGVARPGAPCPCGSSRCG